MEKYLPDTLPNLQKLSFLLNKTLTFLDLETTGLVHENHFSIIEIGLIHITPESVIEKNSLVNPKMKIPAHISEITKIYNNMVETKKTFQAFVSYFSKIAQNDILMGFNSRPFDSKGVLKMLSKYGVETDFKNQIDIRQVFLRCRKVYDQIPGQGGSLVSACEHHNVKVAGQAHRAAYDIAITALLAEELIQKYGFGIFHKEIEKCSDFNVTQLYYQHLVKNKVRPLI